MQTAEAGVVVVLDAGLLHRYYAAGGLHALLVH